MTDDLGWIGWGGVGGQDTESAVILSIVRGMKKKKGGEFCGRVAADWTRCRLRSPSTPPTASAPKDKMPRFDHLLATTPPPPPNACFVRDSLLVAFRPDSAAAWLCAFALAVRGYFFVLLAHDGFNNTV